MVRGERVCGVVRSRTSSILHSGMIDHTRSAWPMPGPRLMGASSSSQQPPQHGWTTNIGLSAPCHCPPRTSSDGRRRSIFGRAISGLDVIHDIESVRTDKGDKPLEEIRIVSVDVE